MKNMKLTETTLYGDIREEVQKNKKLNSYRFDNRGRKGPLINTESKFFRALFAPVLDDNQRIVPSEEMTVMIAVMIKTDPNLNTFKYSLAKDAREREFLLKFYRVKKNLKNIRSYPKGLLHNAKPTLPK